METGTTPPAPLAVVTGGAGGIGRHLVGALAAVGYRVAFTHLGPDDAAGPAVAEERAKGHDVTAYPCDAGDEAAVAAFYAALTEEMDAAPSLLVNNAGVQTLAPLLDLAVDDWDRVVRTHLRGTFLNTQAAARLMVARGVKGAIVNIGSGCNKIAFPRLVSYTAAKGGIEQFTKVAAVELGPHGIRVNCVAPGAIEVDRTAGGTDDYAGRWGAETPLRRVGTPADIAGPVLFFASPAAAFVTGQTLWVDGGVFSRPVWPEGEV
ncbi:SDR family NAD(P)-dependent oxidoreductase [Acuticoccus sediminis]|uniref:SDR family NAD(P)-dependent oxidoreductase n=1 Tax=Acuticoccus sediminis TaxID=2184697 RepID=UPI001CFE2A54|nr:SDR family NAD(P)-dependent oxidoreductase [Acuticoccus sediminis]